MDYTIHIGAMLEDLAKHRSQDKWDEALTAVCNALVTMMVSVVTDHDEMHEAFERINEFMQKRAYKMHQDHYGNKEEVEPQVIDAEAFLRDHFNPGKFHG